MKILKTLGIILIVFAALVVIVGLFMPSKFDAERSLVISAPQTQLFGQVNNLKNWDNWSAWHKLDTNWKVTYSDAVEGAGASYSWVSENSDVGKGKITINKSEPNTLVGGTMEFEGMNPAVIYHNFEAVEGDTKVTFGMHTDLGKNIINKLFFGLMGDKMIGDMYEKSLHNLNEYVKNNPAQPAEPAMTAPMNDTVLGIDSLVQ